MSALANAEHNYDMNTDELVVKEAYANEGPTLKRFRPTDKVVQVRLTNVQATLQIVGSDGKRRS